MTNEATPVEKQEPHGIGGWLLLLRTIICNTFFPPKEATP
jgi:hypothetical protein